MIKRVAVLGAGTMGHGIAEAFVKILKRDYLPFIDLTRAHTAMKSLGNLNWAGKIRSR